jgi:hypothetical protein
MGRKNDYRMNPLRRVLRSSLLSERERKWVLDLECGHQELRPLTYRKLDSETKLTQGGARYRGPVRSLDEAKPAPQQIRCESCGDLTCQM